MFGFSSISAGFSSLWRYNGSSRKGSSWNKIFEFCISTCGVNMLIMNSRVSLGENTSYLFTNLPSSMSFWSSISFTKLSSRLTCEIIILTSRRPDEDNFSVRRLSMNMSTVVRGVLNSWEIVIWSFTSDWFLVFDTCT